MKITTIGMIPARFASTRFPGKPLALLRGKPMVLHVWEAARAARVLERVVVLTDHEKIAEVVRRAGGQVLITGAQHQTGSDRLVEAMASFPAQVYVNIQGDEPLLPPEVIDLTVEALLERPEIQVSTPVRRAETLAEVRSPNTAKVVVDAAGRALYFSRAPIPVERDEANPDPRRYLLHIGLYVYRREALAAFSTLHSPLAEREKLEQLRFLENGLPIQTVEVDYRPLGVDTPADLRRAEARLGEQSP